MSSLRLRIAVGVGLIVLGVFGGLTGIFFTGMTPDGRLAQLGGDRALPSAVLIVGGFLIAASARRSRASR